LIFLFYFIIFQASPTSVNQVIEKSLNSKDEKVQQKVSTKKKNSRLPGEESGDVSTRPTSRNDVSTLLTSRTEDSIEPARPVLVKSVSYPFLCEPVSSRSNHFGSENENEENQNFLDDLWRDFLSAPETKIGGGSDDELL
jgi:hypothetical protein